MTGEVRVPPDSTLAIQPGVEVFFQVYCKLIVDSAATLIVAGSVNDSIRFDESWDWPNNGWHGIRFLSVSDFCRLQYCHLTNGFAWGLGGDMNGGAIYCSNSSPIIQNCRIDSCEATGSGGGIYCGLSSDPAITGNTVSGNTVIDGGGIYCADFSDPTIVSNIISGNAAVDGGGLYLYWSSPDTFELNDISMLISMNTASDGGGMYLIYSSPTLNKNTFEGDTAVGGRGLFSVSSSPVLQNCIVWGNTPQQIYQTSGFNVQATYSDIDYAPIWPGTGNINMDPLFVYPTQGDFRLQWVRPALTPGIPIPSTMTRTALGLIWGLTITTRASRCASCSPPSASPSKFPRKEAPSTTSTSCI